MLPAQAPAVSTTLRFPATDGATRRALGDLIGCLAASGLSRDSLCRVELVLAEVLNNVAEHAYLGLPRGTVTVSMRLGGPRLRIFVRDRGRALPDETLPGGALPDASGALETLPEGGFGWFLIHDQTDGISYRRTAGENCLELQFLLPPGG